MILVNCKLNPAFAGSSHLQPFLCAAKEIPQFPRDSPANGGTDMYVGDPFLPVHNTVDDSFVARYPVPIMCTVPYLRVFLMEPFQALLDQRDGFPAVLLQ